MPVLAHLDHHQARPAALLFGELGDVAADALDVIDGGYCAA
jgi:hypothetical protein